LTKDAQGFSLGLVSISLPEINPKFLQTVALRWHGPDTLRVTIFSFKLASIDPFSIELELTVVVSWIVFRAEVFKSEWLLPRNSRH
jgi:hypothetical protein